MFVFVLGVHWYLLVQLPASFTWPSLHRLIYCYQVIGPASNHLNTTLSDAFKLKGSNYFTWAEQGGVTSKVQDTRYPEVPHPQGLKFFFWPKFFWYIRHELEGFSNVLQWFRVNQCVSIPNTRVSDWFKNICWSSHIDHVSKMGVYPTWSQLW